MTRANAQPGCRHHVGNLAGFKSERVAGFRLECMAGFVGIRTSVKTERVFHWLKTQIQGQAGLP